MLIPKTYPLLMQAVEEGVILGLNRSQKRHNPDTPDEVIAGCITDAVIECILDYFEIAHTMES